MDLGWGISVQRGGNGGDGFLVLLGPFEPTDAELGDEGLWGDPFFSDLGKDFEDLGELVRCPHNQEALPTQEVLLLR